jgi:histidinol phosphatase-like PHP family hydrolase
MFKYETHCHTSEGSLCGRSSAKDIVNFYKSKGYTGIFITDHFINGNSAVDKTAPYEEKIRAYYGAYLLAKEEGDRVGLDVFFGLEFNYFYTEFLVYGLDLDFLFRNKDCDKLTLKEFSALARASGGFVVQAHPFRQRSYMEMIRLLPDAVDAVEVINYGRDEGGDAFNARADWYADSYGLPKTAGSDCHSVTWERLTGVVTPERFVKSSDYGRALLKGQSKLIMNNE